MNEQNCSVVTTQGREPLDVDGGAMGFSSVLSLPYALDHLVPSSSRPSTGTRPRPEPAGPSPLKIPQSDL